MNISSSNLPLQRLTIPPLFDEQVIMNSLKPEEEREQNPLRFTTESFMIETPEQAAPLKYTRSKGTTSQKPNSEIWLG
jgi:hypothetical protein